MTSRTRKEWKASGQPSAVSGQNLKGTNEDDQSKPAAAGDGKSDSKLMSMRKVYFATVAFLAVASPAVMALYANFVLPRSQSHEPSDMAVSVFICSFVYYVLGTIVILVDLWRSKWNREFKALWTVLILYFGAITMPIYWFRFIRHDRLRNPSATEITGPPSMGKTARIIWTIIFVVTLIVPIVGYQEWSSSIAKEQLLDFRNRLSIGQKHTQVALDFGLGRYRKLFLAIDRIDTPARWSVETPLEFGAKNWVLFIEFKDSQVKAVKIRTADSVEEKPKGSPPDLP